MASAALFWFFLTPDQQALKTLHWTWILALFARNCVAVFLFYGAFELRLYIRRRQGNRFKFNPKFPGDGKSDVFVFRSQNRDTILRSFGSGVPIWTACEVLVLWAFANGCVPIVERQPPWPVASTILAGGAERKTGMPVWRAVPPAASFFG